MPRITIVPADAEAAAERCEFDLPLDALGRPDPAPIAAAPDGFPAWWSGPDAPAVLGALTHDPDAGWALRLPESPGAGVADAPLRALLLGEGQMRPGDHATLIDPDGSARSWRIVNIAETPM